ncbi:MAG: ArsR family transcriptional regulator [Rhodospirillales bacterium]|nr:MAG: ArsR family transcriptional regulator [Rhodospirillales bacterium]
MAPPPLPASTLEGHDPSPAEAPEQAADDRALAAVAKALGHPARVRILRLLARRDTCIGCDIVEDLELAQSTVSEHLRILKAAGLIQGRIERPRVCYSLNPESLARLARWLDAMLESATPVDLARVAVGAVPAGGAHAKPTPDGIPNHGRAKPPSRRS